MNRLSLSMLAVAALWSAACGGPVDPVTDAGIDSGTDAGVEDGGSKDAGPADTDVAIVRFDSNGALDETFGTGGVSVLDLSTGSSRDTVYSIGKDAQGRVLLFGTVKGDGALRTDGDRMIARVTSTGALDTTFATNGFHRLDVEGLSDIARNGMVQADGKIVSSGYVNKPTGVGTQLANHIVLVRLNSDGTPDTAFGTNGVLISNPFIPATDPTTTQWGMAEAYTVGLQSTGRYVTTGYGRSAASGQVDVVSCGYTATGLDTSFGTGGIHKYDHLGENDRGRDMVVLPDDRVFIVGSATVSTGNLDALALMLTADGAEDTSFSTDGKELFSFGRSDDAFWGTTTTPNGSHVIAVGFSAGTGAGGVKEDEDSTLLIYPLTGGGTPFAATVPLSETGNDRLFSVTVAGGKIYAAGFVEEGGDSRMVVARFNLDGTLDSTFGEGGIASKNVKAGGTVEAARSVVVMADGKVVIAGNVEH